MRSFLPIVNDGQLQFVNPRFVSCVEYRDCGPVARIAVSQDKHACLVSTRTSQFDQAVGQIADFPIGNAVDLNRIIFSNLDYDGIGVSLWIDRLPATRRSFIVV